MSSLGVALHLDYIAVDHSTFQNARELIDRHGSGAAFEAFSRADECRQQGNAEHFSQWRLVARLIPYLTSVAALGTIH